MKQVEIPEAMAGKYPEWVVFVIAADKTGKANLMPAGWCMITSGSPPMVAVSIHPSRYTHKLIEASGEFVVGWAGQGQEDLIRYSGATSGAKVDKFAEMKLNTAKAAVVKAPLLEGCPISFECRVTDSMTTGDHTVFAGKIVAAHVSEAPVEKIMNFGKERFLAVAAKTK